MKLVLDVVGRDAVAAFQAHQRAETAWKTYIVQCADALKVNSPRYMFDPQKAAFVENPNFKEDGNRDSSKQQAF